MSEPITEGYPTVALYPASGSPDPELHAILTIEEVIRRHATDTATARRVLRFVMDRFEQAHYE